MQRRWQQKASQPRDRKQAAVLVSSSQAPHLRSLLPQRLRPSQLLQFLECILEDEVNVLSVRDDVL
uniref:Uncharacterized protein n=1 Tax=Arundo donax TaxID=35708 RepID=A0A0A9GXP5_ARUDO